MTPKQKIELRLSEVRTRLNEIAGLEGDDFTEEIRGEADALQAEFRALETRHRAAIVGEGEAEARARGDFGNEDGEAAEVRAILDRITIGDYLTPAAAGGALVGAPVELAAALSLPAAGGSGGVAVPWEVLGAGSNGGPPRSPGPSPPRDRMTGRRCSGRSCNGSSGRGSWMRSGSGSIRFRPGGRSGRSWPPG